MFVRKGLVYTLRVLKWEKVAERKADRKGKKRAERKQKEMGRDAPITVAYGIEIENYKEARALTKKLYAKADERTKKKIEKEVDDVEKDWYIVLDEILKLDGMGFVFDDHKQCFIFKQPRLFTCGRFASISDAYYDSDYKEKGSVEDKEKEEDEDGEEEEEGSVEDYNPEQIDIHTPLKITDEEIEAFDKQKKEWGFEKQQAQWKIHVCSE